MLLEAPAAALPDVATLQTLVRRHDAALILYSERKLLANYRRLQRHLPRVQLFFAVKPLPRAEVLAALDGAGASFDIASAGELALLAAQGVAPERLFYSNPIKFCSDIAAVYDYGVRTFVVDNLDELAKLEPYRADCAVVLRLAFANAEAVVNLSEKFGADCDAALDVLAAIQDRGFRVAGLSFHVGSRMGGPAEYVRAIARCAALFAQARQQLGLGLRILNIGGGFPDFDGEAATSRAAFCGPISAALDRYFPADAPDAPAIYAEPGRSVVNSCLDVVTQVVGKAVRNGRVWYYLNDGVYSSFSGCLFDQRRANFQVLATLFERPARPTVFAGPTCDSIDVMQRDVLFPELELGDLLVSRHMGAYTVASATDFNLIRRPVFLPVG